MMYHMMPYGGHCSAGLLLLALASGYAVLTLSNKQERPLDLLGRIIGGTILIVSVVGLLCTAVCGIRTAMACHSGGCPFGKHMAQCAAPTPETTAPDQAPR